MDRQEIQQDVQNLEDHIAKAKALASNLCNRKNPRFHVNQSQFSSEKKWLYKLQLQVTNDLCAHHKVSTICIVRYIDSAVSQQVQECIVQLVPRTLPCKNWVHLLHVNSNSAMNIKCVCEYLMGVEY